MAKAEGMRGRVRTRSITLSSLRRRFFAAMFALGAAVSQAAPDGLYIGLDAAVDRQDFTYGKTVYTEEGLAAGQFTSAESDAAQTLPTVGVFGGYRWQLPGGKGLHVGAELDVAWHPNELEGHLQGTGHTWTDTWPEDWWLQRNLSYGVTFRLGGLLPRSDFNLYALAGVRRVHAEFTITETGCPGPDLRCPPTPLASFTDSVDRRLGAWMLGAGIERSLGERFSLQLEARLIDTRRDSWDRLFEGGVIIPSTISGRETGLALRLIRHLK